MAIDKKYKGKLSEDMLDDWLCSTGYLFPVNELQLERFDKLYDGYDFKLSKAKIDIEAILNGSLCRKSEVRILSLEERTISDIENLRMVARKGQKELSKEAIDKLKNNHKRGSRDKE